MDRLALTLALVSVADRLLKTLMLSHYFSRPRPPEPARWPSVTILQPVTRGVAGLRANLEARTRLDYPGRIRHILLCDAADSDLQRVCREALAAHPELDARLVVVPGDGADRQSPAPKLVKLQAGMPYATGDVLCLMDDDVAPRPDNLRRLVGYLGEPGVGASYALAYYTNWGGLWSCLLTSYVNTYAIENFVAWSYLRGPSRVTGQMACYWRAPLVAAGAFAGLEDYLDDDFVLAQRLGEAGLRPRQAPVICDINDSATSLAAYRLKFARWIILPKQAMTSALTPWQCIAAVLAAPATVLLPAILAILALGARSRATTGALAATLGGYAAAASYHARRIVRRPAPRRSLPALLYTVLVTPAHAALTLLAGNEIVWRGQRLRVFRDGRFERAG